MTKQLTVAVHDVVSKAPWLGPTGIEGTLVTTADGQAILLRGLLTDGDKPRKAKAPKNGKGYPCDQCRVVADSPQGLGAHKRNAHGRKRKAKR